MTAFHTIEGQDTTTDNPRLALSERPRTPKPATAGPAASQEAFKLRAVPVFPDLHLRLSGRWLGGSAVHGPYARTDPIETSLLGHSYF